MVLFKISPPGREGDTSQEVISPPDVIGTRETLETFTISSRLVTP